MLKKVWILLCVVCFFTSCSASQTTIQQDIDKANYCKAVSDCKDLGSHCPFGCNVLVNQSETSNAEALIKKYNDSNPQKCAYDCLAIKEIKCVASKCTAIYKE